MRKAEELRQETIRMSREAVKKLIDNFPSLKPDPYYQDESRSNSLNSTNASFVIASSEEQNPYDLVKIEMINFLKQVETKTAQITERAFNAVTIYRVSQDLMLTEYQ